MKSNVVQAIGNIKFLATKKYRNVSERQTTASIKLL